MVDEETTKMDDENLKMTFQSPSSSQEFDGVEEQTEDTSPALVIYNQCNFETTNKEIMKRHLFEKQSLKGKYVCIQWKYEFQIRNNSIATIIMCVVKFNKPCIFKGYLLYTTWVLVRL